MGAEVESGTQVRTEQRVASLERKGSGNQVRGFQR